MKKVLASVVLLGVAWATPVHASGEEATPDPVDIIILVDESASLSSAAIRSEKEALLTIIDSQEISEEGVRLGVLPFSSGAGSPRSLPECGLTAIRSMGTESLKKCANMVVRQRQKGHADTDFAQAIDIATSYFKDNNATKVIVLLTDGKYDPDGNELISKTEESDLNAVLLAAKNAEVSLWSLGFGKADITALQSYVEKTFDRDINRGSSCSAKPKAVLAKDLNLSKAMRNIINFATCTGHISGTANPDFNFSVSPLLSKINIEATADTGSLGISSVVVKDANGEKICEQPELTLDRWRCTETLIGDNAGNWTLTDRTGKGVAVEITSTGRINIEVIDCKVKVGQTPAPKIRMSRADGEGINFNIVGMKEWPKIKFQVGRLVADDVHSGSAYLDSPETEILGSNISVGDKITVSLEADGDPSGLLLIGAKQISNCAIIADVPTTTTSSSTTTTSSSTTTIVVAPPTTVPPSCELTKSCPPPPPARWPWFLGALAIAAGAFFVWKKMGKKFPEDAELQFQNQFNKSVFMTAENIGGRRRIYFTATLASAGSIEVVISLTKTDARYVMTRDGAEFIKIVSLFKAEVAPDDDGDDDLDQDPIVEVGQPLSVLNGEQFNVRSCDAEDTIGKSETIMLRVQWPEDVDLKE